MSSPVSDALPDGVIPIENGQYLYSCPHCHKATIRIPVKQLIPKAILAHEAVCPSLAIRPVAITSTPDGAMDIVNGGIALALDAQSKPPVTTISPEPTPLPTPLPITSNPNPNVIAPKISATPPQVHQCPECLMQFPTKALLDEHWDFAHRVRSNEEIQTALDSWELSLKDQLIKDYGYTEGMQRWNTYLSNQTALRNILLSAVAVGAGGVAGTMLSSVGATPQTVQKYYNQAQKYVPDQYKKYTQYGSAVLGYSNNYQSNSGSSYKKKYYGSSYKKKYYGSSYKKKYYGSSYKKKYKRYY